jgi:3,4-dihydroxy 2-butanone 4-phosphate synthase/GTP cyclohydrolase II
MGFHNIEELIEDVRQGKMVLLVDDEDRENEGDLVLAAEHVTSQAINFMAMEARGLICLSLSGPQIDRLELPQMVRDDQNRAPNKTAFTVSIEASFGVSTGISAADRAHTIRVAANPMAKPSDVHMPGHIFPIRAQEGGVLKRAGHTEGSVDLARLAGLNPAAVICEVMNADGTMARVPDLKEFARRHNIKIGTIVDLIEYRLSREIMVDETYSTSFSCRNGESYQARVFRSKLDGLEHLAIQKGQVSAEKPVLVRVQLDSYTKDLFASLRDGESSLSQALEIFQRTDSGILLLLRGANKPAGLIEEIKSYIGTTAPREMDSRDYGVGAQILRIMGVHKILLLSNRPEKKIGLKAFDLEIVDYLNLKDDGKLESGLKNENKSGSSHITLQ